MKRKEDQKHKNENKTRSKMLKIMINVYALREDSTEKQKNIHCINTKYKQ